MVGSHLAGASATKNKKAISWGVSRATISKVMSAYEDNISKEERWAKINTDRNKQTVVRWRWLFRTITDLLQQNWILLYPEDPVSTKTVRGELHNPTTIAGSAANLWLLKVMLRCVNDGVTTTKPGQKTTGNAWHGEMVCRSIQQEEFTFGEHPIRSAWLHQWNSKRGRFCDGLGSKTLVSMVVQLLLFMAELLQGSTWTGWVIRSVSWHRRYSEQRLNSLRRQYLHSHSWNCSVMVWRAWSATSWFPASTLPDLNITEPLWSVLETKGKNRLPPSKPIPVTGRGDLWGCEMLRIPHCLDSWITDGVKVCSPTHRPRFTPLKLKTKLHGLSPQANYTDRAIAACQRS
jgi:hypothetical protein